MASNEQFQKASWVVFNLFTGATRFIVDCGLAHYGNPYKLTSRCDWIVRGKKALKNSKCHCFFRPSVCSELRPAPASGPFVRRAPASVPFVRPAPASVPFVRPAPPQRCLASTVQTALMPSLFGACDAAGSVESRNTSSFTYGEGYYPDFPRERPDVATSNQSFLWFAAD